MTTPRAKAAVVTGSLGGVGRALCDELRSAGYFVIGVDKEPGPGGADAFLQLDIRKCRGEAPRTELVAAVRRLAGDAGLSLLVNNASVQVLNATDDVRVEDWDATLETNLIAPFLLIQAFLPDLEKAGGSVVNIASVHAVATKPEFVCYATSKAALVGMTRALAVDLGPRVRVNAVSPAAIATPMLLAGFEGRSAELAELARMHPLRRIAEPVEIAKAVAFLASKDAAFITGSCLAIDGGISGRLHDPV